MEAIGSAALILLLLGAIATAVYWSVVLYRASVTVLQLPTAEDGLALAADSQRRAADRPVLVVIPAHNEENSIGALVDSLRLQDHPEMRVVLALDRCTDRTVEIARQRIGDDPRFRVLEIGECPADWAGKVHAVHRGVEAAGGVRASELLLFTDADCHFKPGALRASAALLADRGLHLLSLFPRLATRTWFERLVQPVAGFELLRQYPLLRVNRGGERQRAFANGQFLMFEPEAYTAVGGHEAVKAELLEDIAFARLIKQQGLRGGLLSAGGIASCAMYDSWAAFRKGWKRIYTESANRRSGRLKAAAWRVGVGVGVSPLVSVAALVSAVFVGGAIGAALFGAGGVGLLVLIGSGLIVYSAGGSAMWALPMAPFGGVAVASILLEAAGDLRKGRATEWGGRSYVREDRAGSSSAQAASRVSADAGGGA